MDASVDLFDEDPPAQPLSAQPAAAPVFAIQPPHRTTLRRIPQGARQRAAQVLNTRLRALLTAPDDVNRWRDIVQYADCLSQPARGGSGII